MKKIVGISLGLVLLVFAPILVDAHQSGCHRWHSCPSDSGSYICGDLGYYSQCPSTNYPKSEPKSEPKPELPEYTENPIPSWIKNNAGWWADGQIDDNSFVQGIKFLIMEGIVRITENDSCSGTARCITGTVTQVIDGDTIKVDGQSIRFALASAPELNEFNGPESRNFIEEICPVGSTAIVDEDDGQTQGSYGRIIGVIYCNGVNLNEALVDSGLGYLTSGFCDSSEFASDSWAQKHGC